MSPKKATKGAVKVLKGAVKFGERGREGLPRLGNPGTVYAIQYSLGANCESERSIVTNVIKNSSLN